MADRALREVDVILFDDFMLPQMLAAYKTEKIYTGKRKDAHHFASPLCVRKCRGLYGEIPACVTIIFADKQTAAELCCYFGG